MQDALCDIDSYGDTRTDISFLPFPPDRDALIAAAALRNEW